jgi:predicted aspartyl protease
VNSVQARTYFSSSECGKTSKPKHSQLSAHRRKVSAIAIVVSMLTIFAPQSLFASEDNFAAGVSEYQNKNFNRAATIFERCLTKQSNNPDLYYYAAITYDQLGNHKKARANYEIVTKRFPGSQAASQAQAALAGTPPAAAKTHGWMRGYDANLDTFPKETWVNFSHLQNAIVVNGAVNGHDTRMIFDTGAAASAFTFEQLAAFGIEVPADAPVAMTVGVGNKGKVQARCINVDLKLGSIERKKFPIFVLANSLPYPLLGDNFFHDLQYTIDKDACTISFKYTREKSPAAGQPISAMTVSASGNYIYNVPFRVENKSLVVVAKIDGHDCPMIFDTGAEICVFSMGQLASAGIQAHATGKRVPLSGTSGQTLASLCVLENAKLGPISGPMICVVSEHSPVPRPLLGQSFFKDWQYTVDQANSVIQFVKK